MNSETAGFLLALVGYPEETATAEYKSGIMFDPASDFGAKLVKHIVGMANAGGGYVIVGFKEETSGKLMPDPAMNESVSNSYETTRLSQSVDSYLTSGQRVQLHVHKIEADSITYPVISVQSFDDSPLFCGRDFSGRDGKPILKNGAVYIRDVAAKTVAVAGPDQFRALLKAAVARHQSAVLNQFRSLLAEAGLSLRSEPSEPPDVAAEAEFQEWSQAQRTEALDELAKPENRNDQL